MSEGTAVLPFEDGSAGRVIRREWYQGRWFFSVVDVVAVLTDSPNPRTYWAVLKKRLADEGAGELLTDCKQLKMRALDGKKRETDAADVETMLRIVQSVPSPKAEPVKRWLAQVGAQRLEEVAAELDEAQRRLLLRGEIADKNKSLATTAQDAGVVTGRDFAVFQDWGYKGLYAGETARDIATRKGLAKGQGILDHMGGDELAANLFRASITEQRLRNEGVSDKAAANKTHHDVGAAVRAFIVEQGATPPEQLPTPPDSIQQLEQREQQRIAGKLQPSLFDQTGEGEKS